MDKFNKAFGEVSLSLKKYDFYVEAPFQFSNLKLTPTPETLFVVLDDIPFSIPLKFPVTDLSQAICTQNDKEIYLRVPFQLRTPVQFQAPKEPLEAKFLLCRNCKTTLVQDFLESLPMPSTNWETLSELWSCHSSHTPPFDLTPKPRM